MSPVARPVPPAATLAERIDAALPQTQCTRCGYADCRAYAQAIADGAAAINRCPPGGAAGIERLAAITGHAVTALDPACGPETTLPAAVIDEPACIGCTLCLPACPVDAILGGPKSTHTVIAAACTGCGLCLPACPVDCIALTHAPGPATGWAAWSAASAAAARGRYARHVERSAPLALARTPADTPQPTVATAQLAEAGAAPLQPALVDFGAKYN